MIFEFQGYKLEYIRIGNGPEPLLAFHGFGQHPTIFQNLEPSLKDDFTVYAFTLFHHGESTYPEEVSKNTPLEVTQLEQMIIAFCEANQIGNFSLLGYSLGGRVCLQTLQLMPERVNNLILLAPDGIKKSFWYHFATQHKQGKKLFRRMIDTPKLFFQLVKYFRVMGFVNRKMEKFLYSQYADPANREKIFNVWNSYSAITPRVRITKETIREYKTPTVIFTGTYDPVLNEMIGKILKDGLEEYVHWEPIKAGHDLIKESYNDRIYPILKKYILDPQKNPDRNPDRVL